MNRYLDATADSSSQEIGTARLDFSKSSFGRQVDAARVFLVTWSPAVLAITSSVAA